MIKDQLARGIIEVVSQSYPQYDYSTHYIPHHAVIRRDKETTKLRVVFDASARSNGPSLNHCLYAGPPLSLNIFDILLRFRVPRIGLIGDIEKAFLMISVNPLDRNVLRFLWVDNINKAAPEIVNLRYKRVMFSVCSSPFLLNATIKYHVEKYALSNPEFVKKFMRSIYVDDVVFGAQSRSEAFELYLKSKSILRDGGFNLRRFVTNCPELRARIEGAENVTSHTECRAVLEDDQSYTKSTLGDHQFSSNESQKVLGIEWCFTQDTLLFDIRHIADIGSVEGPTKRSVVSVSATHWAYSHHA